MIQTNNLKRLSEYSIVECYYQWLFKFIIDNKKIKTYWLLLNALKEKSFVWWVPNDDNRAFEGKNLRELFCNEYNIEYIYEDYPDDVSMLELITALACRCEEIMIDQPCKMDRIDWFWKIISNVGLDRFTDEAFYELHGQKEVDNILNKINDRTYHPNGMGGLFPLKHSKKNQREVELWYQMNEYLVENYY